MPSLCPTLSSIWTREAPTHGFGHVATLQRTRPSREARSSGCFEGRRHPPDGCGALFPRGLLVSGRFPSSLVRFRGSVARPAHPSPYASPTRSPAYVQGLDFLGLDSSQGWTCSIRRCLRLVLTNFLLPVCAGARLAHNFDTRSGHATASSGIFSFRFRTRGRAGAGVIATRCAKRLSCFWPVKRSAAVLPSRRVST